MKSVIYHNIKDSQYSVETKDFIFYFSSLFYMEKFNNTVDDNRELMQYSMKSRYNVSIKIHDYFDFILYSKIEKRGFRVLNKKNGEIISCLNNIILDGEIKTHRNLTEL